ncbi:hypothetical protein B4926_17175 [Vibrio cholerae]|nr:hypothetical protein [Vibrio cholerae]MCD1253186.1 hypothetical protein [Vibrio cholerae]
MCLRVIRNAWHFYYALALVFKMVCSGIGIALLTPRDCQRAAFPVPMSRGGYSCCV